MHTTRRVVRILGGAALCVAALAAAGDAARAGDAPRAIAAIEDDLVADDPAVRAKGAAELTDRFPDGAVAVPMLVDLLDDESPEVVAAAAKAIDEMAIAGAASLCQYVDRESRSPSRTASALNWLLPVIASLPGPRAEDLDTANADRNFPRSSAVPAIGALVPWQLRRAAVAVLMPMTQDRTGERPTLARAAIAMLGADDVSARRAAAYTSPERTAAATSTFSLLRSDRDLRAWMGVRIVARLRSSDAVVVEELRRVVSSDKQPLDMGTFGTLQIARVAAADALAATGPSAAAAAPALLALVRARGTNSGLTRACVKALIAVGRDSELASLLGVTDAPIDMIAIELALAGRTDDLVVSQLAHALTLRDSMPRDLLRAIAMLGVAGKPLLPPLREGLRALPPLFAVGYADAVLAIAPDDTEALKTIDRVIMDNALGAERAWETLATRATPSALLADRLGSLLVGAKFAEMPEAWTSAVDGLARCGALSNRAVGDLTRLAGLADNACSDPATRAQSCVQRARVVVAIGRIGPAAATATSSLTALRDKGDETIRVPAAQALRRIKAKE
jgi:hypothetical protein